MAYELLSSAVGSKQDVLKTITVLTTVTSDWIVFPAGIKTVSVVLVPSGSAKIQVTNDIDGVVAGTAVGIDWDAGAVSVNTAKVATGVKAFRVVSVSGGAVANFRGLFD